MPGALLLCCWIRIEFPTLSSEAADYRELLFPGAAGVPSRVAWPRQVGTWFGEGAAALERPATGVRRPYSEA